MTRLCLSLPSWLGATASGSSGRHAGTCHAGTGICDAYAEDADGRRVPLAPGAVAVGRAVAGHIHTGRLNAAVRAYAVLVLKHARVAPTDAQGAAQALLTAVAEDVRYTPDAHLAEQVQSPERLLATRAGDCDDMAALVGALCEAVGLPVRVVLVAYATGDANADRAAARAGVYDHVFAEIDVAPPGQSDWRAADATLPGALSLPARLGLDPASLVAVAARLTLDPHAPDGAHSAPASAPPTMYGLARPMGNPLGFGNPGGGFGGGLDFGFGPGGGFGGLDFNRDFGGFGSNLFESGLNLGAGDDPFAALGMGGALNRNIWQTLGGTTAERVQNLVAILLGSAAFLRIVFGNRSAGRQDGVIYSPTTASPPPGYRRVVDPATGEVADVPIDLVEREAAAMEAYGASQQGGGMSGGTLALVAAAGVGVYFLARRRPSSR